jgi:hypothetical protein
MNAQQVISAVERIVRSRVQARSQGTNDSGDRLDRNSEPPHCLADIIGVDPTLLHEDERIGEILRVDKRDLSEKDYSFLRQTWGTDFAVAHAVALLDVLEKAAGRDESILDWPQFQPPPHNEGEWIERILGLTVAQVDSMIQRARS